jgi:hypothetical protein
MALFEENAGWSLVDLSRRQPQLPAPIGFPKPFHHGGNADLGQNTVMLGKSVWVLITCGYCKRVVGGQQWNCFVQEENGPGDLSQHKKPVTVVKHRVRTHGLPDALNGDVKDLVYLIS